MVDSKLFIVLAVTATLIIVMAVLMIATNKGKEGK